MLPMTSGLELWSADVMSAYILSPLQSGQEVYMNDPEDPKGDHVSKLNKALYGLKNSKMVGKSEIMASRRHFWAATLHVIANRTE